MKIADLRAGLRRVDISGTIIEISPTRDVVTRYGEARVATAILSDDSGEINLTLWNEQIDQVSDGDSVQVENGYVTEFRSEPQLNVGRYGTLNVLH